MTGGERPLHLAAIFGHSLVAKLLVDAGEFLILIQCESKLGLYIFRPIQYS